MNISFFIVTVALLVSGASAFAHSSPSLLVGRGVASSAAVNKSTSLFSEPAKVRSFLRLSFSFSFSFPTLMLLMHPFAKEEEGGLDLDLSEMFDM